MYHFSTSLASETSTAPTKLTQENLAKLSSMMTEIDQTTCTNNMPPKTSSTNLLSQIPESNDIHKEHPQTKRQDTNKADPSIKSSNTNTDLQGWVFVEKKHGSEVHTGTVSTALPSREKRIKTGDHVTDRLVVEDGRSIRKSKPETLNRGSTPRTVCSLHSGLGGTPMIREIGVSRIRSRNHLATVAVGPLTTESISAVLMSVGSQFPESKPFTGMHTAGDGIFV